MSILTVEVEIENGIIRPCGADVLPAKARGFLTILEFEEKAVTKPGRTLGDALRELNVEGRGEYTDLSTNKKHLEGMGL